MAEGLLSRFLSRPGQAQALMNMGAQLMAGGAPSYDPGASARAWGAASAGYGDSLQQARELQLREQLRKAQMAEMEAQQEERKRKLEQSDALSRTLLGSYMGGEGPATGSVRGAQDAGMTSPGALASFEGTQGDLLRGLAAAGMPEKAAATALELSAKEAKAPTTREVKSGDSIVTQEFVGGKWRDVATGRRYKPQEGADYKPQTEPAKLRADRAYLKGQGLPDTAPEIQAIDRKLQEFGRPSSESMRTREMVVSGANTLNEAVKTLMPDGQTVDMGAVTSMWANLPKSQGRTTKGQIKEAVALILRLETGAAATESEVDNVASRYVPNPLDSQATAKDKLERLQRRFANVQSISSGKEPGGSVKRTPGGIEYEVLH